MPTNVTHEYVQAQEKYENAKSPEEKMLALQEMRRYAPAHKGGENLRREISKKMAALKKQIEKQRDQKKKTAASGPSVHVKKEGIGQVVLAGQANTGKSTLLKALTKADVEIAPYPFTTKKPEVGMAPYKGSGIQVVEIPALMEGSSTGRAAGTQLLSVVRNSDEIVVVLNGSIALQEFQTIMKEFENANIKFNEGKPKIEIKQSRFKGITISGKQFLKVKESEFANFLKSIGIYHASVILAENTTLEKVTQSLNDKLVYKKGFVIINKYFGSPKPEELEKIRKKAEVVEINELNERILSKIRDMMFERLGKILIYTKKPGEEADMSEPLVLKEGSTVADVAEVLHKDFARKFKYVKIWGSSKYPGQRVSRDYKLKNCDIVEIYS